MVIIKVLLNIFLLIFFKLLEAFYWFYHYFHSFKLSPSSLCHFIDVKNMLKNHFSLKGNIMQTTTLKFAMKLILADSTVI